MSPEQRLDRLARVHGVATSYDDVRGERQVVAQETIRATLTAMGVEAADAAAIDRSLEQYEIRASERWLPATCVRRDTESIRLPLHVAGGDGTDTLWLVLHHEHGARSEWTIDARHERSIDLGRLEPGYHAAELFDRTGRVASTRLIVTPARGFLPAALRNGGRVWGPAVQLYALRGDTDWGIGGFEQLRSLVESCREIGAGVIGVSPLHAGFASNPGHCSPYSPSSRAFLQWIHLDLEAIPEMATCRPARRRLASAAFRSRLETLRRAKSIDYAAVAAAKRELLELVWDHFRRDSTAHGSERHRELERFVRERGRSLEAFATFEALDERFRAQGVAGWSRWPEEFRRPENEAVARFAAEHEDRIGFFRWLQWECDRQLDRVGKASLEASLAVGLYQDLAVSVDGDGFESWYWQEAFTRGATIGAPPDDFNLLGQNWGLLPWIPSKLVEAGYRPFVDCLRANMRHAGALRVDHVMGLMRSFWVPRGMEARAGTYVHYPFEDLLGVLALESVRNQCLVIGEDLGTVPDEVRRGMESTDILSYRLLYFSRDEDGEFIRPGELPRQCVVSVSTHDLPTLAGWWEARDIELRDDLDLFPEERSLDAVFAERRLDRVRLLRALRDTGLLPADVDPESPPQELSAELVAAVHRYLARSPAMLAMFQLEDALGLTDQANLPGTTDQHPNWRRRLPVAVERLVDTAGPRSIALALREERR